MGNQIRSLHDAVNSSREGVDGNGDDTDAPADG